MATVNRGKHLIYSRTQNMNLDWPSVHSEKLDPYRRRWWSTLILQAVHNEKRASYSSGLQACFVGLLYAEKNLHNTVASDHYAHPIPPLRLQSPPKNTCTRVATSHHAHPIAVTPAPPNTQIPFRNHKSAQDFCIHPQTRMNTSLAQKS